MSEGSSTQVYRLTCGRDLLYLRVAEVSGALVASEAAAHERLRSAGVSLPEVVAMDDGPEIGRGVLIVRSIPGTAVASTHGIDPRPVLWAAGRDLARISAVPVDG